MASKAKHPHEGGIVPTRRGDGSWPQKQLVDLKELDLAIHLAGKPGEVDAGLSISLCSRHICSFGSRISYSRHGIGYIAL